MCQNKPMEMFGTAAILAGGKSTRMGFDKQRILHERVTAALRRVFPDILVVTARPELYRNVRTAADEYAGCGPLAGIHAAVKHSGSRYVYITACDMPDFSPEYAAYLMARVRETGAPACVTLREGGKPHPFHGLYGKALLPALERDLTAGLTSPGVLLADVGALFIPACEAPDIFCNLNTEAELAVWRASHADIE
ncbi:MAG TPA: molybdenum cofactor guanylyltransferase [Terriglobales bacterium]|nr:molybdenum cofactor guanylyltransferase [Terriglobales bacterium]